MVNKGVAIELLEPVFFDKEGQQVLDKVKSYGCSTRYKMTHPEAVFFVNEVGDNMSQKADGNINGEKCIITKHGCTLSHSLLNDCHFTILGFTAATGEPLCCAILNTVKKINPLVPIGH